MVQTGDDFASTEMGLGETCIPALSVASDWVYSMICEIKTLSESSEGEDEAIGFIGVRLLADALRVSMTFLIKSKC
jgi:hypothetical protein